MSNETYLYHLDKSSKKYTCPACGKKRFVLYVSSKTGEPLADTCGRCDREFECGYHLPPAEYFRTHPEIAQDRHEEGWRNNTTQNANGRKTGAFEQAIDTIPIDFVKRTQRLDIIDNLRMFLNSIIDPLVVEGVAWEYGLGMTKNRDTIFWRFDMEGRCRSGKQIKYNPENGHRDKDITPFWAHKILKDLGIISRDWELKQCLFGEHLLKAFPDAPAVLVEGEKTAVVGRCLHPEYIWLATGGITNNIDRAIRVLEGRRVLVLPDSDAVDVWRVKFGGKLPISDCYTIPGTNKDFADLAIDELKARTIKL